MGRFRAVFALLALGLLLPAGLLVRRAFAGVAVEREARHRAVAERVFDEMERALSDFVVREEERPLEAWQAAAGAPPPPFVLGYFEVEPGGRVTGSGAGAAPGEAERVAAAWFAARGASQRTERRETEPRAQAPGTTVSLERTELNQLRALGYVIQGAAQAPAAPPRADGAYDALQSLNRGALERAERQRKTVVRPADELPAFEAKPEAPARSKDSRAGPLDASEAAAGAGRTEKGPTLRVAVDPLVGRLADDRHLLLYRSVLAGEQMLRQGLVLEFGALEGWLRERALGAVRLPGASLSFTHAGAGDAAIAPDGTAGSYVYQHRFAEPFDAVAATLSLAPLAGASGEGTIYALSTLLLVAGATGLFALYRMVAVRVGFAERRSNFVAAVTHELRTPLTAIRMSGELLRDGIVTAEDKRREHYGIITAESERLGRLIENVLDLARIERGASAVKLAAEPLRPLLEQNAAELRPRAEREGFALHVSVPLALPPARVDRDALRQVLENLVENAIKYARDASRRTIEIEARARGDRVLLSVRDFGPGVAPRQLARIFEPFHRGEDERVRTTQGTGLGLALVRGWVERMGGRVVGRNALGGGFEVSIELNGAPPGNGDRGG